jgi:ABC-2 type transport system ATP-binding protein
MIETQFLTRKFGSHTAVDNLNLLVQPGELFGFLGPNGAGKTTTIRMLIGLLQPTSGTARIANLDLKTHSREIKRLVGFMSEETLFYEKLSGEEFLRFIGGLYGLSDREVSARGREFLRQLDMQDKAASPIQSYSHGMRQKLAFCAAMLHQPSVLLLDEPFSGLDPRGARLMKDMLRDFCRKGGTVLLSTHTLEIAERICDRVGILNRGRLIATGSIQDLRGQAHTDEAATLEDLFLQLTGGREVAEMVATLGE